MALGRPLYRQRIELNVVLVVRSLEFGPGAVIFIAVPADENR